MIHELLIFIAVVAVLFIVWRPRRDTLVDQLGIEGDLIWIDDGRHTKTFLQRKLSGSLESPDALVSEFAPGGSFSV